MIMRILGMTVAVALLLCAPLLAQESSGSGPVNSLTVNPTQNQELTGTMGTETGQPNDVTPGSENMPNGLVPVTTNMMGSGSNGNTNQNVPGVSAKPKANSAAPKAETRPAHRSAHAQGKTRNSQK